MKVEGQKNAGERTVDNGAGCGAPVWWRVVPREERAVLCAIAGLLGSAKGSKVRGVAVAARKWEPSLLGFIKTRLVNAYASRRSAMR